MTKIAAIQMISAPTIPENLVSARRLISQAAEQGAKLVLLPEYWAALESRDAEKIGHAEEAGNGPVQSFMSGIAKGYGIWLLGGSLAIKSSVPEQRLKQNDVHHPEGHQIAQY